MLQRYGLGWWALQLPTVCFIVGSSSFCQFEQQVSMNAWQTKLKYILERLHCGHHISCSHSPRALQQPSSLFFNFARIPVSSMDQACKAGQRGIAADNREFDKDHQKRSNNEPNPLRQSANKVVHCPDREKDDCPKWKNYEKELEVQTISIFHACLEQTLKAATACETCDRVLPCIGPWTWGRSC